MVTPLRHSDKNDYDSELKASKLTKAEAKIIDMLRQQSIVNNNNVCINNNTSSGGGSSSDQQQEAGVAAAQHLMTSSFSRRSSGIDQPSLHAFWDTQPMQHHLRNSTSPFTSNHHCPIIRKKEKSELRQTPFNMPKGFEWSDVDIFKENERLEVYDLLAKNYVEDDDCLFRFDYSPAFLLWALTPPGFNKAFHLGVRSTKSKRLMAFITGVPASVRAYDKVASMVEINFLCVHKKLRSKRLAPVLIKEITRRVNHTGIFQAVYTAGVTLPVPVASCRYYHRSLNPKKLVEIKFSSIPPRMTLARMQKLYKLPDETRIPLRSMTVEDVPSAHKLLNEHLKKFRLAVCFSEEDFSHWLLPRKGVIDTYVRTLDDGEVTDMCSFYHLPSTIIGHPKHSYLRAVYSFYNVARTVDLTTLIRDSLIMAKKQNVDVFNALSQMENSIFFSDLKFGVGDGTLHYYLYNWSCPKMDSKDVGIVLL